MQTHERQDTRQPAAFDSVCLNMVSLNVTDTDALLHPFIYKPLLCVLKSSQEQKSNNV